MAVTRTFSIIKPDATRRNLTGAVTKMLEEAGLRIVASKRIQMTKEQAEGFYAVHKERPFFGELVDFMISGPVVVQVLEGEACKVSALYAKILQDKRHHDVTLISFEQVTGRCFEDWSMRVADLNDLPLSSRDLLRAKYSEEEGYIEIPDDNPRALALLFDARALCLSEAA